MKVKLEDIVFAIETTDQYTENFLDEETGEIEWISEMAMTSDEQQEVFDRLDEHGFYRLPTSFDIHEYGIIEDFVYSLRPCADRDQLERAIRGKGAFRRFKNAVNRMGIEQVWYAFQENAYREKAIRWCEENGIEYE